MIFMTMTILHLPGMNSQWKAFPLMEIGVPCRLNVGLDNKKETITFNIDDEVVYNESHDAVVLVIGDRCMKGCARIHSNDLGEIWVSASSVMPNAP